MQLGRAALRTVFCLCIYLNASAKSIQNPLSENISHLLDKPFFTMYQKIRNNNLAPEIKRHLAITEKHSGFNEKTKLIARIALAEYYIAIRDFPEARNILRPIHSKQKILQTLKPIHQARYYQAKGVCKGYITSKKINTKKRIKQGIVDFDIAENIFAHEPFQTEELFRAYFNKARHYLWLNQIDTAFKYIRKAERILPIIKQDGYKSAYYFIRGNIEMKQNAYSSAKNDFKKSRFFMNDLFKQQDFTTLIESQLKKIEKIKSPT